MSDDFLSEMAKNTKQRPTQSPGSTGGGKSGSSGSKEPPGKPASQSTPYGPKSSDSGKKK